MAMLIAAIVMAIGSFQAKEETSFSEQMAYADQIIEETEYDVVVIHYDPNGDVSYDMYDFE